MTYKLILLLIGIGILFESFTDTQTSINKSTPQIEGTWKLLSTQKIVTNDTTYTNYSNNNLFLYLNHVERKQNDYYL